MAWGRSRLYNPEWTSRCREPPEATRQTMKKLPALILGLAMGAFTACGTSVSGDPEVDTERLGEVLEEVESLRRFDSDGEIVKTEGDWLVARIGCGIDSTGAFFSITEHPRRLDPDTDRAYIRIFARGSGLGEIETDILLEHLKSARNARNAEALEAEQASR